MSWLICFTLMASTSIFFSVNFNKRFEESMPLITFSIILLLFFFGLIDKLKIGVYFVIFMMIIISIYSIVKAKGKIRQTIENIFTPTFFIFVVLSFLIRYLDRNMILSNWDEFSHWGRVVKATFLTNQISTFTSIDLLFRTYPPAISLFQYFVLFFRGVWNEGDLYSSYVILGLILFLPFLKNVKWKSRKSIVSILLLMLLSPMLFYNNYYNTILIDAILAIFFGYCLAEVYLYDSKDNIALIRICLAISILTIIKDSGLFFAFISCFALVWKMIYIRNIKQDPLKFKARLSAYLNYLSIFVIPLITNWLWKLNISLTNTPLNVFTSPIKISELLSVLIGRSNDYRLMVIRKFISSLISENLTTNIVAFSFIIWVAILILLLYLFCLINIHKSRIYSQLNRIVLIGLFMYTFGLLITYLFKFGEYEAIQLASYSRYIGTYLEAVIICLTMLVVAWYLEIKEPTNIAHDLKAVILQWALVIFLMILIPMSNIENVILNNNARTAKLIRNQFYELINKIDSLNIKPDSKIWILSEHSNGFDYWVLQFDLVSHPINPNYTWSVGKKSSEEDVWTLEITVNEWKQRLQDYDYLVIYNVNDSFIKAMGTIFNDESEIKPNSVYSIDKKGFDIELTFLK